MCTVRKIYDFFVTHEIKKESESSKSTVLGAINFVNLESFSLEKRTKANIKSKFRAIKFHVKMVDYGDYIHLF